VYAPTSTPAAPGEESHLENRLFRNLPHPQFNAKVLQYVHYVVHIIVTPLPHAALPLLSIRIGPTKN
jgi:hypothetical protein